MLSSLLIAVLLFSGLLETSSCVPSFVRRCPNVGVTYYFSPESHPLEFEHATLDTIPYAGLASTQGGWELNQNGANEHTLNDYAVARPGTIIPRGESTWGPSPKPSSTLDSTSRTWRSLNKITGSYQSGQWQFTIPLHLNGFFAGTAVTKGKISARIFHSTDRLGTNAIEATSGLAQTSLISWSATAEANQTINFNINVPLAQLNNEYLFIVLAYQDIDPDPTHLISGFIDFRPPATMKVITPAFIAGYTRASSEVCVPFNHPEIYLYIAPDGTSYPLDVDGRRVVLSDTGTGTPPYEYITQRGPFQHGESLTAVYAHPRVLQLMINHRYENRDSYWNGRRELLGVLSPRKQLADGNVELGVLRRILSTGEKRDLKCLITEGPKFEPRHEDTWQEYSYTETLRFTALDPIYYDPTIRQYNFDKQGSQLVFPITFPISFTTILQDITLGYMGTWFTYPTFRITGPMTFVHLVNETTNEQIDVTYNLAIGETITIALAYGSKSVTKNDGTNLLPYVSGDSDLGTFHLTEVNQGLNQLHVHMVGVSEPSEIVMNWNDRYVGI